MTKHPDNCRNCELGGDPSFCGIDPGNREPYACNMCDRYEVDLRRAKVKLDAVRKEVELCGCECVTQKCLACRLKAVISD